LFEVFLIDLSGILSCSHVLNLCISSLCYPLEFVASDMAIWSGLLLFLCFYYRFKRWNLV